MTKASELTRIPGVGPSIAKDLQDLGVTTISSLKNKNPQDLYDDLIERRGQHQDRCVLYVFRCAVYFAKTPTPDKELLKWWNWKDKGSLSKRSD